MNKTYEAVCGCGTRITNGHGPWRHDGGRPADGHLAVPASALRPIEGAAAPDSRERDGYLFAALFAVAGRMA